MENINHSSLYYLLRDVLRECFSSNQEINLASTFNRHLISKVEIRNIFRDEVKQKKPNFRILQSCLIILNNHLRILPNSAYYEVIENLLELQYCFKKDKRKIIKRLSAQTILRLFTNIYYEVIFMPLSHPEDKEYIEKFKEYFSRIDILQVIKITDFYTRLIFEEHGLDIGFGKEKDVKINKILDKFYGL
jgi:hypothetical protein